MKKAAMILSVTSIAFIGAVFLFSNNSVAKYGYVPPQGFIPDSSTAVKVAEAVLIPIYGEKVIKSELPLNAHLNSDSTIWEISGKDLPKGWFGGVVEMEIQKMDAKVLYVMHGK